MKTSHLILLTVAISSTVLPVIIGIKRNGSILLYYVILSLGCDLLATLSRHVFHVEYHYITNVFILGEMFLLSLYYKEKVFKGSKLVYLLIVGLTAVFFITLPAKSILLSNKTFVGIFHFFLISYALLGLYALLKEQKELFLEQSSFFWANVAFLLYASTNVLFFLSSDYMEKTNHELFSNLWIFLFLPMNTIKNILLAISFSKERPSVIKA